MSTHTQALPNIALASHALLRIVASYLLLTHASAKLFHVPHIAMFDNLPLFRCSARRASSN